MQAQLIILRDTIPSGSKYIANSSKASLRSMLESARFLENETISFVSGFFTVPLKLKYGRIL